MGGTPTRHHTHSRRNKGRSHFALKQKNLTPCSNCGILIKPNTTCPNCGFYKGKPQAKILKKIERVEQRKKEKATTRAQGK